MGGMVEYGQLGLPNRLAAKFKAWQDFYDANFMPGVTGKPNSADFVTLENEQIALAKALHEFTGQEVEAWLGEMRIVTFGQDSESKN
ncbi:MAG: hypothetical protein QF521_00095 [Alphaproteobacteria bacterium]|nr:hypothetical protein [Alphaproteobacteria bacterium]